MPDVVIPTRVVREWDTETDDRMVARRLAGASIAELAEEFGDSPAHVHLVLRARGVSKDDVRVQRARLQTARERELGRRISDLLDAQGPLSAAEVAHDLGTTVPQVRTALREQDRGRLHKRRPRRPPPWQAGEEVDGLRAVAAARAAALRRKGPVPVSMAYYDGHRDLATTPTGIRVSRTAGSWERACTAAGLPIAPPPAKWSDDDVAWWVAVYLQRVRRGLIIAKPSPDRYAEWAREDPRIPGLPVVLARLGTWAAAVQAARAQRMR